MRGSIADYFGNRGIVCSLACAMAVAALLAASQAAAVPTPLPPSSSPQLVVTIQPGLGLGETLNAIISNSCQKAVEVTILARLVGEEENEIIDNFSQTIPPSTSYEYDATNRIIGLKSRQHVAVEVSTHTGPCTAPGQHHLRVAYAVVDTFSGKVREVVNLPAAHPPGNPHRNSRFVYIGEDQEAEAVVVNHCDAPIDYALIAVRNAEFDVQSIVIEGTLEAGEGAIRPLSEDAEYEGWIELLSFGQPIYRGNAQGQCGGNKISASLNVFDTEAGTTRSVVYIYGEGWNFGETTTDD